MRMTGLKGIVLAAGLMLAGVGHAATPAANAAPAAPAATAAPAASSDPLLAQDGAPAMAVSPDIGHPIADKITLQPQVTTNGNFAHWMHNWILLPVITAISLLVLFLLLVVVVRFRASRNPVPSKTSHNTFIEIIWTAIPVLILAGIALPSIGLLQAQYRPAPDNAVTLKAIGNQWFWSYEYPDLGDIQITANMLKEKGDPTLAAGSRYRTDADGPELLATDNRVVLPVGVPIRLITTSNDVIHSWAMPAFWIKLDAVPGRLNETSFTINKPGLYFGQCSELCGARHGFMPISVEAVSPQEFAAWVKAKGGSMPGQAAPSNVMPTPAATTPATATGPTENATAAAPTSNQAATANPAGLGQTGN